MYQVSTCKEELEKRVVETVDVTGAKVYTHVGGKIILDKGNKGFLQSGDQRRVHTYAEHINQDKYFLDHCTLQDAVNASKALFDMARGLQWILDHDKAISEEFEMLALTPDGIKWLKKHELEVKENVPVIYT
jgi:hypothetical protein